jgi:hypothetical protein
VRTARVERWMPLEVRLDHLISIAKNQAVFPRGYSRAVNSSSASSVVLGSAKAGKCPRSRRTIGQPRSSAMPSQKSYAAEVRR